MTLVPFSDTAAAGTGSTNLNLNLNLKQNYSDCMAARRQCALVVHRRAGLGPLAARGLDSAVRHRDADSGARAADSDFEQPQTVQDCGPAGSGAEGWARGRVPPGSSTGRRPPTRRRGQRSPSELSETQQSLITDSDYIR
jgi:hypothetical protein